MLCYKIDISIDIVLKQRHDIALLSWKCRWTPIHNLW